MPLLTSGGMTLEIIPNWVEDGVDIFGIGSLLTKGSKEETHEEYEKGSMRRG